MPSKLISYILGGALAFSFIPELKASNQEEEKPKRTGRQAKVPEGYKAPHSSLIIGVNVEAPDEESPKTRQRKRAPKKAGSDPQTQLPNFDTLQTKNLLKALDNISTESPVPQDSSAKKTERGLRSPAPKKMASKKPAAPSSDATPSSNQQVKRGLPPAPSRVPVTIDVPLEEVSSAPPTIIIHSEMLLSPKLPPVSPAILPYSSPSDTEAPQRREITTLDVATVMPRARDEIEEATSSSSPKQKTPKGERKKEKIPQASSSTASPSKGRTGKNYSPDQFWELMPTKRPQVEGVSLESKAKGIIAPKEVYPIHILLTLASGTKQKWVKHPSGKDQLVTRHNKVYIPEIGMYVEYIMVKTGTEDTLKSKLLFDAFSKDEDTQNILNLIRIQGKEDLNKAMPPQFMQKVKLGIESLTHKHWYQSRIRAIRVETDKRLEGNTFGNDYDSNFGEYSFYEDGNPIENLQVRLLFSALKKLDS